MVVKDSKDDCFCMDMSKNFQQMLAAKEEKLTEDIINLQNEMKVLNLKLDTKAQTLELDTAVDSLGKLMEQVALSVQQCQERLGISRGFQWHHTWRFQTSVWDPNMRLITWTSFQ